MASTVSTVAGYTLLIVAVASLTWLAFVPGLRFIPAAFLVITGILTFARTARTGLPGPPGAAARWKLASGLSSGAFLLVLGTAIASGALARPSTSVAVAVFMGALLLIEHRAAKAT